MNMNDIIAMIDVVCAYNCHELLYDMHHGMHGVNIVDPFLGVSNEDS